MEQQVVKPGSWLSRLFLRGDAYGAWMIRSRSSVEQRDVDILDRVTHSPRSLGFALGLVLSVGLLILLCNAIVVDEVALWRVEGRLQSRFSLDWAAPTAADWLRAGILAPVLVWCVLDIWLGYRKYLGKFRYYLLQSVGVALVPTVLAAFVMGSRQGWHSAISVLTMAGFLTVLCTLLLVAAVRLVAHRRQLRRNEEQELLRAEAESERLARRLSEAHLRLLQAQIEPHFLFNTLGAVQQLAEAGAPRASALTASLIHFLRGSMAQMRAEQVGLGEDFILVEAYLRVMQARLGDRLRFALALPQELAGQRIPTMMLLTLVENAIKHGIEPALRGGRIDLQAFASDGQLHVQVSDTGQGVSNQSDGGVGLANIRERLRLQYGDKAELQIPEAQIEGFTATLRLPLE
ncbi:hypothetical protein FNU76_21965 [Chitinimonas arctica]|uniref:Uncharacterized protein n=1 Tax=Chitinimonas arctica TaxID=2594795 RepID=A0A516SKW2_9NEIS|nr:histidine kinase [Chitinimonas arctica]QDQ28801.1 hypothetical protein FNU76_21965 [Chitinimonas arctica]